MVEIRETDLPGVGLRHEFTASDGRRVGVISYRSGKRQLFVCEADDPDRPAGVADLDAEESVTLAGMLGGLSVVETVARLQARVKGLVIEWLQVPVASPYAGRTLGDTRARTRTGVSVVALIRDQDAVPSPGPEASIRGGDTLVVVGTADGISALAAILAAP